MALNNTSTVQEVDLDRTLLGRFVLKVPPFLRRFYSDVAKMRKLEALQAFKELQRELSREERELYFYDMAELYKSILMVHYRNKRIRLSSLQEMREALVDFLRIVLDCKGDASHVANLVRKMKEALLVDSDFFLKLLPPRQWELSEYLLSCCAEQLWWGDIRGSKLLMRDMEYSRERCLVLLKYGFPYRFERQYFYDCCFQISYRLQLKGEYLPEGIFRNTWSQENLRLQMALEILSAVFNERGSKKKAILGLMWKTVPHPFISSTEMSRRMAPFFVDHPQKLRDLCEEYTKRNTVFEVPEVTSPRSLMHLSRVQARKNLMDAKRLREGAIECLDIPRSVKDYLKLDYY